MPNRIDELRAEVDACLREASGATSGGEGLAMMVAVRDAQAKLAAAYVAAADAAMDETERRASLEQARATMAEVLASEHGPEHDALLTSLADVLARLDADPQGHRRAIGEAWVAIAEHRAKYGWPKEGDRLARRVLSLVDGLGEADDVRARARACMLRRR